MALALIVVWSHDKLTDHEQVQHTSQLPCQGTLGGAAVRGFVSAQSPTVYVRAD